MNPLGHLRNPTLDAPNTPSASDISPSQTPDDTTVDVCPECGAPAPRPPGCERCGAVVTVRVNAHSTDHHAVTVAWPAVMRATAVYLCVLLAIRVTAVMPGMHPDVRHGVPLLAMTVVVGALILVLLARHSVRALRWITWLATVGVGVSAVATGLLALTGMLTGPSLGRAVVGVLAAGVWGVALRRGQRLKDR